MADKKFLDQDGLLYFWSKIKSAISTATSTKVDKVNGKGLSTNDYTTAEKNKLSGIATGAEVNVQSDWSATSGDAFIKNKPTNVSAFTNDAGYLTAHQDISGKANKATTLAGYGITNAYTKTEIDNKLASALNYKGTVASFDNLPASPSKGDVYNITSAGGTDANGTAIKAGDNVAYNGAGWDVLGGTTDLSAYVLGTDIITNTQIDTIVAT